jgi:hypothetical protein
MTESGKRAILAWVLGKAILNLSLFIGGIVLIGFGTNFYISFGAAAFVLFLKESK